MRCKCGVSLTGGRALTLDRAAIRNWRGSCSPPDRLHKFCVPREQCVPSALFGTAGLRGRQPARHTMLSNQV